jgi:hypothetical protein
LEKVIVGAAPGVTLFDAVDGGLTRLAPFFAVTVNVYAVPFVRLEITQGEPGHVAVETPVDGVTV